MFKELEKPIGKQLRKSQENNSSKIENIIKERDIINIS